MRSPVAKPSPQATKNSSFGGHESISRCFILIIILGDPTARMVLAILASCSRILPTTVNTTIHTFR